MKRKQTVIYSVLTIYLLTWFVGVPRVINHNTKKVLNQYVAISVKYPDHPKEYKPSLDFKFILPLLPFVIISKHDYRIANLNAAHGGVWLYIWYGLDLYEVPIFVWMS